MRITSMSRAEQLARKVIENRARIAERWHGLRDLYQIVTFVHGDPDVTRLIEDPDVVECACKHVIRDILDAADLEHYRARLVMNSSTRFFWKQSRAFERIETT